MGPWIGELFQFQTVCFSVAMEAKALGSFRVICHSPFAIRDFPVRLGASPCQANQEQFRTLGISEDRLGVIAFSRGMSRPAPEVLTLQDM